jgi:Spy/CpxP family protein refolding chaperone
MQRSKSIALMFVAVAILIGAFLGISADRLLARDEVCPAGGGRRASRAQFAEQLGLDAAQRAAVDTILDAKHRQISALLRPMRPQLDSISENAREQIARRLTPEQRVRFDEIHREMKSRSKDTDR